MNFSHSDVKETFWFNASSQNYTFTEAGTFIISVHLYGSGTATIGSAGISFSSVDKQYYYYKEDLQTAQTGIITVVTVKANTVMTINNGGLYYGWFSVVKLS